MTPPLLAPPEDGGQRLPWSGPQLSPMRADPFDQSIKATPLWIKAPEARKLWFKSQVMELFEELELLEKKSVKQFPNVHALHLDRRGRNVKQSSGFFSKYNGAHVFRSVLASRAGCHGRLSTHSSAVAVAQSSFLSELPSKLAEYSFE